MLVGVTFQEFVEAFVAEAFVAEYFDLLVVLTFDFY